VVLLTFQAASWTTLRPEMLANLAAGMFILPFFLFSATAGQLADKYDKARLARLVKLLEIAIMLVAAAGFWLHSLAVAAGRAVPARPALDAVRPGEVRHPAAAPEAEEELVGGNALVEAGTFVAILIGTLAGGLLAGAGIGPCGSRWAGHRRRRRLPASRGIPPAPAAGAELAISPNPLTETWRNIGFARENRTVFLSILGISWFWLYGALFLAQFPAYAKNVLGGGETLVTCCWPPSPSASASARCSAKSSRRARRAGAGAVRLDRPDVFGSTSPSPRPLLPPADGAAAGPAAARLAPGACSSTCC
jgi:MFS family permease